MDAACDVVMMSPLRRDQQISLGRHVDAVRGLQIWHRDALGKAEGEALQDDGKEEEQLHPCQGLSQAVPGSCNERRGLMM